VWLGLREKDAWDTGNELYRCKKHKQFWNDSLKGRQKPKDRDVGGR